MGSGDTYPLVLKAFFRIPMCWRDQSQLVLVPRTLLHASGLTSYPRKPQKHHFIHPLGDPCTVKGLGPRKGQGDPLGEAWKRAGFLGQEEAAL